MQILTLMHILVYLVPIVLLGLGPWLHAKTGSFSRFSNHGEMFTRTVDYIVKGSGAASITTSLFLHFGQPMLAILTFAFATFIWYQYFAPIWNDYEAKIVNP